MSANEQPIGREPPMLDMLEQLEQHAYEVVAVLDRHLLTYGHGVFGDDPYERYFAEDIVLLAQGLCSAIDRYGSLAWKRPDFHID